MGIPTGGYPKMITVNGPNGLVPAVFPAGHAKQFKYVILNNAADETALANVGVAPVSTICSGGSSSWENRHGN